MNSTCGESDVSVLASSCPLSPREREVLALMAERTNKEIAAQLGVEVTTVNGYVRQIFTKLGVRKRSAAVLKARIWHVAVLAVYVTVTQHEQMLAASMLAG